MGASFVAGANLPIYYARMPEVITMVNHALYKEYSLQLRKAVGKLVRGANTATVGTTTTQAVSKIRGINTITASEASARVAKQENTAF